MKTMRSGQEVTDIFKKKLNLVFTWSEFWPVPKYTRNLFLRPQSAFSKMQSQLSTVHKRAYLFSQKYCILFGVFSLTQARQVPFFSLMQLSANVKHDLLLEYSRSVQFMRGCYTWNKNKWRLSWRHERRCAT